MHPRTLATLDRLSGARWFSNVGIDDTEGGVVVLSSWEEAVASCTSLEWENLCLEAVNSYCTRLAERAPERFQLWNSIIVEVKRAIAPIVRKKIDPVVEKFGLPKRFENVVSWDIMHVCMEAEYADVYPPGYYASQAYWYVMGHFPCGWEGEFPEGKLIVY